MMEHGVEPDQALDRTVHRHRQSIATPGFTDSLVQRAMVHVIEPCAVVNAAAVGRISALHELGEKGVHLLPVRGARKGRVLTRDAHAAEQ